MMSSRSRVQAPAVLEYSDASEHRMPWDEVPEVELGPDDRQQNKNYDFDGAKSVTSENPAQRLPAYLAPTSLESLSSTLNAHLSLSKDINRLSDSHLSPSHSRTSDFQRTPASLHRESSLQRESQENALHRLREAVRFGDWNAAESVCLQLLSKVQSRDTDAVLGMIGGDKDKQASQPNSVSSEAATVVGSKEPSEKAETPMCFSPHITVVEPKRTGDYVAEQVASGLAERAEDGDAKAREDAKELLSLLQPLMCSASQNRRASLPQPSALLTADNRDVDIASLRDAILAVARHATKVTEREGRLLEVAAPCYVLGDIHGNLSDLEFFARTLWPAGVDAAAGSFLFLGDFVDRGKDSVAVAGYVMAMKVLHADKWRCIRGNHETREVNGNTHHYQDGSFLRQCGVLFGEADGPRVWEAVNCYFDVLPLAALLDRRIFCVHGGIPAALTAPGASLQAIRDVECPLRSAQYNRLVYDMLWSDPATPDQEQGGMEGGGFGLSPRGCACFGEEALEAFLARYRLQHVFRGHEAQKTGVGVSKANRLTTIFSTSKDHFQGDPAATCGCVLVEGDVIKPIVRAKTHSAVALLPTYVGQSVEATEHTVLPVDPRPAPAPAPVHADYPHFAPQPAPAYSHYQTFHAQPQYQAPYQAQFAAQYHDDSHVKYVSYQASPPPQPQSWPAQSFLRVQGRQY